MRLFLVVVGAIASCVFVGASVASDSPPPTMAACGELDCRANGLPFVTDAGAVTIMPGESFSVELKIEGGKISGVVPRKRKGDLANSLELEFGSTAGQRSLSIKSHSDQTIKYDAVMKLSDGRLVPTSSCPVRAGLGAFELWIDAIVYLELQNIRFLDAGNDMACR